MLTTFTLGIPSRGVKAPSGLLGKPQPLQVDKHDRFEQLLGGHGEGPATRVPPTEPRGDALPHRPYMHAHPSGGEDRSRPRTSHPRVAGRAQRPPTAPASAAR